MYLGVSVELSMMYAGSKNQLVKFVPFIPESIFIDSIHRLTGMSKVLELRDIEEFSDSWLR